MSRSKADYWIVAASLTLAALVSVPPVAAQFSRTANASLLKSRPNAKRRGGDAGAH
jgi:hypothetical protein